MSVLFPANFDLVLVSLHILSDVQTQFPAYYITFSANLKQKEEIFVKATKPYLISRKFFESRIFFSRKDPIIEAEKYR